MSKLHIPGPEPPPKDDYFGDIELGALICFFFAATVLYAFNQSVPPQPKHPLTLQEKEDAELARKLGRAAKNSRKMALKLNQLSSTELASRTWSSHEIVAVLRFGKRATTEATCQSISAQITSKSLDDEVRLALLKSTDRRENRAPYTCLSHLYFDGDLAYPDLTNELKEIWTEAQTFSGAPQVAGSVVNDFRKNRRRPESPEFYAWLRDCALNPEYAVAPNCRLLLHTIAPKEGRDLLEVFQRQLSMANEPADAIPRWIGALGDWTRNGQPAEFKVKETKLLPDYDVDFKQGALFMLCRFVFSPDKKVAALAAEQLADTAHYGARGFDRLLMQRWRHTCYNGFNKTDDEKAIQILAVWNGKAESKPIYSLQPEIDNGRCKVTPGYPLWYCGSRGWNGEGKPIDEALADFFVDTRNLETSTWDY